MNRLANAEQLQEAVDRQIAMAEVAILLGFLAIGGLLLFGMFVIPALEKAGTSVLPGNTE